MDGIGDRLHVDDVSWTGNEWHCGQGDVLPLDGFREVEDARDIVGPAFHLLADDPAVLVRAERSRGQPYVCSCGGMEGGREGETRKEGRKKAGRKEGVRREGQGKKGEGGGKKGNTEGRKEERRGRVGRTVGGT